MVPIKKTEKKTGKQQSSEIPLEGQEKSSYKNKYNCERLLPSQTGHRDADIHTQI